ncbi:hypothetical protein QWY84_06600 [Aquisalimonas lutea]|nr:hypothetical protein [Aquisalimonas lutea]MDN3517269.1 hypothetical protein [Aquisalimonas lutea]
MIAIMLYRFADVIRERKPWEVQIVATMDDDGVRAFCQDPDTLCPELE